MDIANQDHLQSVRDALSFRRHESRAEWIWALALACGALVAFLIVFALVSLLAYSD